MDIQKALLFGLVGLAVAGAVIPLILRAAHHLRLHHSRADLHHTNSSPVPRFGGLALLLAFLVVEAIVAFSFPHQGWVKDQLVVTLSGVCMFVLGFLDDLKPLGAKVKLVGQVGIAVAVYACGFGIHGMRVPFFADLVDFRVVGLVLTVVWLVGMTNLINLIDGVDGLAGGITLIIMMLLGVMMNGGTHGFVMWGLAGALLGFLWFNFPPARIYLGDGGAYFLGFLIGLVSLLNYQKSTVLAALVAPLLVLALPILDTSLAIARRGLNGLPLFRADRLHIHHRLISSGMSRRKVVLTLYGVTLFFLGLAFMVFMTRGQQIPLSLGIGVLALLLCGSRFKFSREWFAVTRVIGHSLAIRGEVRYALTHTRWLAMEGQRTRSFEDLWQDLVFVGRKFGFNHIKLTLDGRQREWSDSRRDPAARELRKAVTAGGYGVIEVSTPLLPDETSIARGNVADGGFRPCPRQDRLFPILCELLAEGWMSAARHCIPESAADSSLKPAPVPALGKPAPY